MSISFSGLASGLDTTSWVQSLTALKRAKVETYQAEKQNILLSQQTLNNIKSFFTGFRSVIERITDSKFGKGNLDLFSQNLAVSSKPNILTATASSAAENGTYEISVSTLASQTQAKSGYTRHTTETIVETATLASTLSSLGAKAGKVSFNVDGITRTLNLSGDDTIEDFINKLDGIGVQASYDESKGSFRINLSTGNITDTGNTNIVNALNLKNVNSGYKSSTKLYTNITEQVYENATLNTRLSELGVSSGSIELQQQYIYASARHVTVDINNSDTIGDFIDVLSGEGVRATFSDDGYLTLENAEITNEGGTGILNAFGWNNPEVSSRTLTSEPLKFTTTYTEGTVATRSTLLKDLVDGSSLNDGDTIIYATHSGGSTGGISGYQTMTISTTSTIGDFLDKVGGSIDSNGVIEMNNYVTITGGTCDISSILHLEGSFTSNADSPKLYKRIVVGQDVSSSSAIKVNGSNATLNTNLSQLGWTYDEYDQYITIKHSDNTTSTINITSGTTTLRKLKDLFAEEDIAMDLNNGTVTLSCTNGSYIEHLTAGMVVTLNIVGSTEAYRRVLIDETDGSERLSSLYMGLEGSSIGSSNVEGKMIVHRDDTTNTILLTKTETIDSFKNKLSACGIDMTISKGRLYFSAEGNTYLTSEGLTSGTSQLIDRFSLDEDNGGWSFHYNLSSTEPVTVSSDATYEKAAEKSTKLSDLGVTSCSYLLYENGVKHTLYVSSEDTLGDFMNNLQRFGIESRLVSGSATSTLELHSDGDSYIAPIATSVIGSNIIPKLFRMRTADTLYDYTGSPQLERTVTNTVEATLDTRLKDIVTTLTCTGTDQLTVKLNNNESIIKIKNTDTIGDVIGQLQSLGVDADFVDGKVVIQSGYDNLTITAKTATGATAPLKLTANSNLGGYAATDSNKRVYSTTVVYKTEQLSVANSVDHATKMKDLNITSGSLTIYKDGAKGTIQIEEEDTIGNLESKIYAANNSATFDTIHVYVRDGKLVMYSTGDEYLQIGSTSDTSNFVEVTGMQASKMSGVMMGYETPVLVSSRPLCCVNEDSNVTTSRLFRRGDVTVGNFKVGDETIVIDYNTTLKDIISQINYSEKSNATAYWDSVEGQLVIKSKTNGASLINIEKGTSNFTDIMGLTNNRLNIDAQELGRNAKFTINGTEYVSSSNIVGSEISHIQGVTIDLKNITAEGETVTLNIEKDRENISSAMEDIVNAYNDLIDNVDKEIARDGNLSNETTLKVIRNQIRNLMTGAISTSGAFKTLDSIGISPTAATSGNIRTDNINTLSFNKDNFMSAYNKDATSVKEVLVGDDTNKGILTKIEDLLEQSLGAVTGYFDSANKSYTNKISKLNDKINKTNKAADRYKARLENKFQVMDRLISTIQNNYSSFLT